MLQQDWKLKGCGARVGWFSWSLSKLLTQLCKLTSELTQFMLSVRICCPGGNPAVNKVCNLLRCILGVVGLVQQFAILSSFARGQLRCHLSESSRVHAHEPACEARSC